MGKSETILRNAKWDNLKFCLIVLVVLGHMLNMNKVNSRSLHALHVFIYIFHMPAFMFVSGLFSKNAIQNKRYDKAATYLLLYLFMQIFQFIVSAVINGKPGAVNLFSVSGVPWFALSLFICYLVTMVISKWDQKLVLISIFALGIIAGYEKNLGSFLAGMRTVVMYPFFYIGYICPVDKLEGFAEKKSLKVISTIIFLLILIDCYVGGNKVYGWMNFLRCNSNYESLGIQMWGGVYRILYYLIAMLMVICAVIIVPRYKTFFSTWGSRTMQVYALHYPILQILNNAFHMEEHLAELWPGYYKFLLPIIAFILTIILSDLPLQSFFQWITNPLKEKLE